MGVEIKVEGLGKKRIGVHSHIRGLGLDEKGKAIPIADGLVGLAQIR